MIYRFHIIIKYNLASSLLGCIRLGAVWVCWYVSFRAAVRGYTTAASAHAVVAQLKYILGVSPKRFNGPLSIVYVSTI